MNCIIPGLNLKIVAKALHALAKVGDDLYIEARKDKLALVAVNLRRTICVQFYFLDSFFSSYEIDDTEFSDENDCINCKIRMKTLLPLFKGTHLEKKFEYVKLEYENASDVLILKMKYKCDDILMTHQLRLMDSESLTIEIKPDGGCNNILTSSSLYNQLLGLFSNMDDEITLEITKQKVIARNYCVGAPVKPKHVRSQVNLNSFEFNSFQISKETTVNFSLKPFRTAINFADSFNLNIGLNFETGGRPLAIAMKNPTFDAIFIVATLNPNSDIHSSMAASSIPAKITQHNVNLTTEDQDALKNEDWGDFEMEEMIKTKRTKTKKKTPFSDSSAATTNDTMKQSKINKIFCIPEDDESSMDVDQDNVLDKADESPQAKKAKLVFGRCFESTFARQIQSDIILAPNSDSE